MAASRRVIVPRPAVTRASLLHRPLPAPFERDPASAVEGRVGVPKTEDEG